MPLIATPRPAKCPLLRPVASRQPTVQAVSEGRLTKGRVEMACAAGGETASWSIGVGDPERLEMMRWKFSTVETARVAGSESVSWSPGVGNSDTSVVEEMPWRSLMVETTCADGVSWSVRTSEADRVTDWSLPDPCPDDDTRIIASAVAGSDPLSSSPTQVGEGLHRNMRLFELDCLS